MKSLKWNKELALKNLNITEIPYDLKFIKANNVQDCYGYSPNDGKLTFAVKKDAPYIESIIFHEIAHNVLGHTKINKNDLVSARDICKAEMEAALTSGYCCKKLGLDDQTFWQLDIYFIDELRTWVKHGELPPGASFYTRCRKAADRIMKAGVAAEKVATA